MDRESTAPSGDEQQPPVFLVSGASGAIGGEIARQAAATGATVAVHGSSISSAEAAVDRLRAAMPEADLFAVGGDFHQPGDIEKLIRSVIDTTGRLDNLVHCAITGAPGVTGAFQRTDPDSYARHTALVIGSFQELCFHALPYLAVRGGTIIALTSDAGRFAAPRQSLIGAANGGLISFVRNLAVEIAREGVRINCISPSYVEDTPAFGKYAANGRGETARQRAGLGLPRPGDIAPLALFLCGPGGAKITGQVISVNGGLNA